MLVFQGDTCRTADPWLEEITGISPAQLRRGWDRAVHPEDLARLREALADCLEGRRGTATLSLRLVGREGRAVPAEALLSPTLLDGEPAALVVLEVPPGPGAGPADYARLFAAVSDLVVTHDMEGRILAANPAVGRVTGRPASAWLGRPLADMLAPDVKHLFADYRRTLEREGRARGVMKVLGREGGEAYLEYESVLLGPGPVAHLIARDVTDRILNARYKKALRHGIAAVAGHLVECRDPRTVGHQRRVAALAVALAEKMGLGREEVEDVRLAALLHDIGKAAVPAEILLRPGPLSDLERRLLQQHPRIAVEILRETMLPPRILAAVAQHHERLDGSGYPAGLGASDIELGARIIAVADVLEAMTAHRPYRPALPLEAALEELAAGRGVRYDPEVVRTAESLGGKSLEIMRYALEGRGGSG